MSGLHAINLSTAWSPPADEAGRWVRRFGRPAGIEPGDAIWLVVESPSGCCPMLNGDGLPAVESGGSLRHDVTGLLGPRNELVLTGGVVSREQAAARPRKARCPLPAAMACVRLEIEPRGRK